MTRWTPEVFKPKVFEAECQEINEKYKYNNAFFVGGDFAFSEAVSRFNFLDGVLEKHNNAGYMTVTDYVNDFDAHLDEKEIKTLERDFFVLRDGYDGNGRSWSGYYTTKPRRNTESKDSINLCEGFKLCWHFIGSRWSRNEEVYLQFRRMT